jgi:hypothetical protein
MITGILPLIAIALEDDKPEVMDLRCLNCIAEQCCCMTLCEA